MPLTDIFAAFRWWAILTLIGAIAAPLVWTLFRRLPDRGYAFVKMAGLLLVSYVFWLLGSLGFLRNDLGGIVVALALVTAVSLWTYSRADGSLTKWLRENKRQVFLTELLFLAVFAGWSLVRAQNPAITATEKPMEFAFLNGVGRSPTMPPLDPWLSGFAISYYYFGYVMTSLLARLAATPEAIAFNLGLAWLMAGTAVGAFGIVYNLVAGINHEDTKGTKEKEGESNSNRLALILGLIAALALPLAGNQLIILEVAHANNLGSAAFWEWLDVRDLSDPPNPETTPRYESSVWWWWRSSRVIHEYHLSGRPEEGLEPIVEFPGFSFILGDMHPHVLALPFAFLSLAVAYLWFLEAGAWRLWPLSSDDLRLSSLTTSIRNRKSSLALWLFTAVVLGGLSFLNTWDVLIHLFVVLGAYLLARTRRDGWDGRRLAETAVLALSFILAAILLYLPFYLGFRSQAGAPYLLPMLMRPTRLAHYLIIFAMPLWSTTILLLTVGARRRFRGWRRGAAAAVSLVVALFLLMLLLGWIIASSPSGALRVQNLAAELNLLLPPRPDGVAFAWGARAVLALLPPLLAARLAYPALTLLLMSLIVLVAIGWRGEPADDKTDKAIETRSPLPFVLLLILTGTLLTLGPEFVYLRDNFGMRLNTTFKFYYQAWVMFGVAALFGLGYLWRSGANRALPALATTGYALMLALALLFPFHAVQSRAIEYRGPVTAAERRPPTLDGLAQMAHFHPAEYDAIQWLRHNEPGTPVIVEAVGGQYSDFGRVSAGAGLPTLLGWPGHEYQWRGDTPEPAEREPAVQTIYTGSDWGETAVLLNQYNVSYIYVGRLERDKYGPGVADKFDGRLEIAYQNEGVTIYRWQPE